MLSEAEESEEPSSQRSKEIASVFDPGLVIPVGLFGEFVSGSLQTAGCESAILEQ